MSLISRHQKTAWFLGIGIVIIFISFFYYTNLLQASNKKETHIENMHGDIIDRYETIKSLKEASDIVAVVEISVSKNISYDEFVFGK